MVPHPSRDDGAPRQVDAVLLLLPEEERGIVAARLSAARPDIAHVSAQEAEDGPGLAIVTFAPPPVIGDFPNAGWVHCAGAGVDRLLGRLPFSPPLMTRTVGRMGEQIAEWTFAYLLADLQRMAERRALQARREWDTPHARPQRFLFEQKILVLGTGEIGARVAQALAGMGAMVDGLSRSGRPKAPFGTVYAADEALDAPLQDYDAVVSLLPCTEETRRFVGPAFLGRLEGALFLSAGRGETVDEGAVLGALDAGRLRGAVLDVFEAEPLPEESPLWTHPLVTVTPHIAGLTRAEDTADAFLASLEEMEAGRVPALAVDIGRGY